MPTSDFLYLNVVGDRNLTRNLQQMPDTVRTLLLEKVKVWTSELKNRVEDNIVSRLKQKTGKLLEGLDMEVTSEGLRVEGRVYIAGVPYAHAQDKGALIPPHIIRPKNAKILAFIAATGDKVFATRVFHPGGQIPATHFMGDAYREMAPQITRGIKDAVVKGIRAQMRQR